MKKLLFTAICAMAFTNGFSYNTLESRGLPALTECQMFAYDVEYNYGIIHKEQFGTELTLKSACIL
nr:hypothetical protein [uncultured Flavobacterium sp.]